MPFLVHLRLPDAGHLTAHTANDEPPVPGSRFVVETGNGREIATVFETSSTTLPAPEPGMARLAGPVGPDEERAAAEADRAATKAMDTFSALLQRDGVIARPLRAHYDLGRRRLILWHTAPAGGPDIKTLEGEFRRKVRATAVDLRSVAPREAAALLGGCGCCGRTLCCASWQTHATAATAHAAPAPFSACGLCGQTRCCQTFG